MTNSQGEITQLLLKWNQGHTEVLDDLMPLVYPHLREVAAAYIRRESNPGLLQATSLVHELYFRLLAQNKTNLDDRVHFYTFSAHIMRLILIDNARENHALRRGGTLVRVPLNEDMSWIEIGSPEIMELDRALEELELLDPKKVKLVELRYFLGCTAEETAELTQVSKATVDRELRFIRSWLYRRLHPEQSQPSQLQTETSLPPND